MPSRAISASVTRGIGALYSRRADTYKRLDARWTRWFDTPSGRISLFVDIYNALNNRNQRDVYYDRVAGTSQFQLAETARRSLPRIPSIGFNWEF